MEEEYGNKAKRLYKDVKAELFQLYADMGRDLETKAFEGALLHTRHRIANIISAMGRVVEKGGEADG